MAVTLTFTCQIKNLTPSVDVYLREE